MLDLHRFIPVRSPDGPPPVLPFSALQENEPSDQKPGSEPKKRYRSALQSLADGSGTGNLLTHKVRPPAQCIGLSMGKGDATKAIVAAGAKRLPAFFELELGDEGAVPFDC